MTGQQQKIMCLLETAYKLAVDLDEATLYY
jgi:hypothetical protein